MMNYKAYVASPVKGVYIVRLECDIETVRTNPAWRYAWPVIEIPCRDYPHAQAIADTYNYRGTSNGI